MSIIKIEVTQEHIARGRKTLPGLCPIALAIRAQTSMEASVGPLSADLYPYGANRGIEVELPYAASRFIGDFDRGLPVDPFTFELTLP